ncbi:ferric reductase like transmembrane component-domain-containing protein [Corynascus similis CBS 632.67]
MKLIRDWLLTGAFLTAIQVAGVLGDGTGLIGYGKTLYNPTCAFACRGVVKGCKLLCTPTHDSSNYGTAHSPVSTPPDCFVNDEAFLRTMALCIDNYCSLSDNPPLSLIEDYWASHLATGTLGDYAHVPAMSYQAALTAARKDERLAFSENGGNRNHSQHGDDMHTSHKRHFMIEDGPHVTSALPHIKAGEPLNSTSFILPADWQRQYNGMFDFEVNETGHSTYTIVVMLIAILLPVPLSLVRFVPGLASNKAWSLLQSALIHPATFGTRHRAPVAGGTMPTRGQALYISLISILNIIFLLAPYVHHHPQSTFGSLAEQSLSIIGNRAGVMAMGNVIAVFLFSARNNVLLWITDWSHGTYLLLHRWLGYWAVFHTALHSVMLLEYYRRYGDYAAEFVRDYWVWGIVGTVAVCAIVPTSLLVIRQKVYEMFLGAHVVLAVLFIVGYYYHIWYCYGYSWGYEIWAFVAAGIWATERLVRVVRMAWQGYRTATVTVVHDTEGEYLAIDIEGKPLNDGVAYLSFPTIGWRVWESHPFSVAFGRSSTAGSDSDLPRSAVATAAADNKEVLEEAVAESTLRKPTTAFLARVRNGVTQKLYKKVTAAGGSLRLAVLVDGTYRHSGAVKTELSRCSNIVYVAGGVGITALLPYIRQIRKPSQLFWGSRRAGLASAVAPALKQLPANVEVETSVGQRLDLEGILYGALTTKAETDDGPVGIVVCGPAGMADQVRHKVVQLSRCGVATRPYVLVDEAFTW